MFTDEQDIERTLRAALTVEPSAGFEAGVRQRLQDEAPARRYAPAWLAAAAAVALLAGGGYLAVRDTRPAPPVIVTESAPRPDPPVAPVPAPSPAPQPAAVRPAAPGPASAPAAAHPVRRAGPEVIVPPNQLEMIERLLGDVQAGRVALPDPDAQVAEAPAVLDIAPIVVDPIPVVPVGTGAVPDPVMKGFSNQQRSRP